MIVGAALPSPRVGEGLETTLLRRAGLGKEWLLSGQTPSFKGPCRTGKLVEFTEYGGDLLRCTLAWRTVVVAEIVDAGGNMIIEDLACAENRYIEFRTFGRCLLERCVRSATDL